MCIDSCHTMLLRILPWIYPQSVSTLVVSNAMAMALIHWDSCFHTSQTCCPNVLVLWSSAIVVLGQKWQVYLLGVLWGQWLSSPKRFFGGFPQLFFFILVSCVSLGHVAVASEKVLPTVVYICLPVSYRLLRQMAVASEKVLCRVLPTALYICLPVSYSTQCCVKCRRWLVFFELISSYFGGTKGIPWIWRPNGDLLFNMFQWHFRQ